MVSILDSSSSNGGLVRPHESRYFVGGAGEVRLTRSDFKAQGGEGAVYVKGSTAYKIYTDPRRAIPHAKVLELSALTLPNIVRPLDVLTDAKGSVVGYTMRHVEAAYTLCQLFPKSFRSRERLTPDAVFRLVRRMQEGVRHIHARGILVVDLNEMNFLVADDFGEIFFIDVDSYHTPSFPANALMETVRDRHATAFSEGTDWFSFAVVSFQMFAGVHPFRGTYPPFHGLTDKHEMLDARMRANVSVLNPEVKVPASCLPFEVIPPAYLEWYGAVFERGERMPPPERARAALFVPSIQTASEDASGRFVITLLREFDGEVISHDGVITLTRASVYFGGARYSNPRGEDKVVVTPRLRRLVSVYLEGGAVRFRDLGDGREFRSDVRGEELMIREGRVYVRQAANILEVEFIEASNRVLIALRAVCHVMPRATRLYDGVAVQSMLGAHIVSLFASAGSCVQARLAELNGYRVVDARLSANVLMVVGVKEGRYDKFIFRFADGFGAYDVRLVMDVSDTALNFVALDSGVCLHLNDADELEVFARRMGSREVKVFGDSPVAGYVKLLRVGRQAMFARGNRLYSLKVRTAASV